MRTLGLAPAAISCAGEVPTVKWLACFCASVKAVTVRMAWYRDGGGLSRAPCYESRDARQRAKPKGRRRVAVLLVFQQAERNGLVIVVAVAAVVRHCAPSTPLGGGIPRARHDEDAGVARWVRVCGWRFCGQGQKA